MRLQINFVKARLRAPFVSGSGSLSVRELLLVSLEDSQGLVGFGEAAPLESYDGVAIDEVRAALEDCRQVLARSDGRQHDELLSACTERAILPQAVAAIDLALWDLASRRQGQPVWKLLGVPSATPVEVNWTIAAEDRAGAGAEAAAARNRGFDCVKVKVGVGDDAGRLAAVRAMAGAEMAIRLDANGAWSVDGALGALRALEPAGIELCEEPVSGIEAIEELSAVTRVPLAIDETAAQPGALERRVCRAACLKIARCGGLSGVIDCARRARRAGYEIYLASTLDGPLGIAAALHASAALRPERPCGLATLGLFDQPDPLPARDGRIEVPMGLGLSEGMMSWYGLR